MSFTGERPQPSVPPVLGTRAGWLWGGHHVIIQSWEGRLAVVALLTGDPVKPSRASGARWDILERPPRQGVDWSKATSGDITEWKGRRNKRLDLPILIEGWVTRAGGGQWIETQVAALEEMQDTPLTLRVVGPIPYWGVQWVIDDIDYGDYIRDAATGRRMRQSLLLHLLEYVQPDQLAKLPRAKAAPKPARTYSIVKGDTLQKIATKTLGKASRWQEIVKLNTGMRGIKLDAKKFPVGHKIKVPAK